MDDIQNLLPDTLKLSSRGFSCRLNRTKTTGPGKLHGQVAVFVKRSISLTGYDWLGTGMGFTEHESFAYKRDYLVPAPNSDFDGFIPKVVEPPVLCCWTPGYTKISRWILEDQHEHVACPWRGFALLDRS